MTNRWRSILATAAWLTSLSTSIRAETIYIDFGPPGPPNPPPPPGYTADLAPPPLGANVWNVVGSATQSGLIDAAFATPTDVEVTPIGPGITLVQFNNALTAFPHENLVDDFIKVPPTTLRLAGEAIITVRGLNGSTYTVYTYAWAPDAAAGAGQTVTIQGAVPPSVVIPGGAWDPMDPFGPSSAPAVQTKVLSTGDDLVIKVTGTGADGTARVNGVQIIPVIGCHTCRGDVNGDNAVNASDVRDFVRCYLTAAAAFPGCGCSDLNGDNSLSPQDVNNFVQKLLGIGDPDPACP